MSNVRKHWIIRDTFNFNGAVSADGLYFGKEVSTFARLFRKYEHAALARNGIRYAYEEIDKLITKDFMMQNDACWFHRKDAFESDQDVYHKRVLEWLGDGRTILEVLRNDSIVVDDRTWALDNWDHEFLMKIFRETDTYTQVIERSIIYLEEGRWP